MYRGQIVELRHSLAKIPTEGLDANTAFLLMALKPDICSKDVKKAIQSYEEGLVSECCDAMEEGCEKNSKEAVRDFVDALVSNGLSGDDALRAATACGISSLEEALIWVMDNQTTESTVEQMDTNSIPHDPSFAEKLCEMTDMYTREQTTVADKLGKMWKEHLQMQEAMKFQEFVGLKQLCEVLQSVAENVQPVPTVQNSLPWLKLNEPNLIIEHEVNILQSVLSLYSEAGLHGLRFDTVFVCNHKTTAEGSFRYLAIIYLWMERL